MKKEVQIISRDNSECLSQLRKDCSTAQISAQRLSENFNQDMMNQFELTTSPKLHSSHRKNNKSEKSSEFFKLTGKRK